MSLVSTIVPCYKQAHYLPFALGSVQKQTYQHWECIIVDDGSPDETQSVAREWVEKDSRFRYVRKANGGLSSARNAGISAARGSLLHFLDADDYVAAEYFEQAVMTLEKHGDASMVYGGWALVDVDATVLSFDEVPEFGDDVFHFMLKRCLCPCHALVTRRAVVDQVGYFDETLGSAEDWDMWLRIAAVNPKTARIRNTVAYYRQHPQSMSYNYKKMLHYGTSVIRKHARSHGNCGMCRKSAAFGEGNLAAYVYNITQRSLMEECWRKGEFLTYLLQHIYFVSVNRWWAWRGISRVLHSKRYVLSTSMRRLFGVRVASGASEK